MPPLRVCIECGKIVRMARQIVEKLAQKLDQLPNSPGCYQMHNAAGKVIYVGKAVVLRNRVRSYFPRLGAAQRQDAGAGRRDRRHHLVGDEDRTGRADP
jgi:hypothetical protein